MSEPVNGSPVPAPPDPLESIRRPRFPLVLAGVAASLLTTSMLLALAGGLYFYDSLEPLPAASPGEAVSAEAEREIRELSAKTKRARKALLAAGPRSVYVVVDTARNRLYVKRGEQILHEAACSTGSGGLLKDPDTDREWLFETPRGKFEVIRKAENPVWNKPDWAFVEEGKPIPESWSERRDYDTLGNYALYFGDGYMIHGTLYQRYLGRSITHGCVRLGDQDLERVYRMTPLGAPILIF